MRRRLSRWLAVLLLLGVGLLLAPRLGEPALQRLLAERLDRRHAGGGLQLDDAGVELAPDDVVALEFDVGDGRAVAGAVAAERLSGRIAARGRLDRRLPDTASLALHGEVIAPAWLAG